MAGQWTDEDREREYWLRDRRYDEFGLNEEESRSGGRPREQRSFGGSAYGGSRSSAGPQSSYTGRDASRGYSRTGGPRYPQGPVFGENDYGAEYNRPAYETWQRKDYRGVSPAMRQGEYDAEQGRRERSNAGGRDYTGGGRYLGDDARERLYRQEYGQGGYEYGPVPRGYEEGRRFGTREADERWAREMRRPVSGGTGGYDYERGYGDAARGPDQDRSDFEGRAHDAGAFFRRTGQRIQSWFSDMGRGDEGDYRQDYQRYEDYRNARGLGPKGYKRSDDRISDEVHQRLTDDPWLDATNVNVSVSNGEVTLAGTVENREAKHRAERVVEDLSGVTHVQNNLRVQQGNYFTSAPKGGYGESVQAAQMRNAPAVQDVTDGGTGSADAQRQQQEQDSAATRTTTRRT